MKSTVFGLSSLQKIVFVLFVAMLSACSGSSSEPATQLSAEMTVTRFGAEAVTGRLDITTGAAWTVKEADGKNWVSFSPAQGEGDAAVEVVFTKNDSGSERFAHLVVSAGNATKHLYVSQKQAMGAVVAYSGTFFELPKDTMIGNAYKITRFLPAPRGNLRNYTMFYDPALKIAHWVAYPLTSTYLGNTKRTDRWDYDPLVAQGDQATLFNAYSGGYSRGHQIPSADRTADATENATTFFFTNMTPQNYTLNGGLWADLEARVRTWSNNADTLYVVTGAIVRTKTAPTVAYARDNNGASVAVPQYYYKALAQKRGSSYYTIAFKMENVAPTKASYRDYQLSVSELEQQTGFTFFPLLPKSVKNVIDSNVWY